jgi:hypothetical protein
MKKQTFRFDVLALALAGVLAAGSGAAVERRYLNAADDAVSVDQDTAISIDVAANDSNEVSDFQLRVASQPVHGSAAVVSRGVVRYTPEAGYTGSDSFTYEWFWDPGLGDQYVLVRPSATVRVQVNAVAGPEEPVEPEPETGGPAETNSALITRPEVLRQQTLVLSSAISRRIARFVAPRPQRAEERGEPETAGMAGTGLWDPGVGSDSLNLGLSGGAAGDAVTGVGVWGNLVHTRMRNDLSSTAYEGPAWTLLAGVDRWIDDRLLLGAVLGYEDTDLDTEFNQGDARTTGWTFSPYLAYTLMEDETSSASATLIAGHGWLSTDTRRRATGSLIEGAYDSDRWLLEATVNYYRLVDAWTLQFSGGYLWAEESTDAFRETDGSLLTDTTSHLGVIKLGAQATYWADETLQPYIGATYLRDTEGQSVRVLAGYEQPTNDKDEVLLVAGFDWTPAPAVVTSLEVSHGFFREDIDNTSVSFNLRAEF